MPLPKSWSVGCSFNPSPQDVDLLLSIQTLTLYREWNWVASSPFLQSPAEEVTLRRVVWRWFPGPSNFSACIRSDLWKAVPLRPHCLDPIQNYYSLSFRGMSSVLINVYYKTISHLTMFPDVTYYFSRSTHPKYYLKNCSDLALGIFFSFDELICFFLTIRIFAEDEVECLWEKPKWLSTEILTELSVLQMWSDSVKPIHSAQTSKSQNPDVECHWPSSEVCFSCHL